MLVYEEAWRIVYDATSFASHSMQSAASQTWPVELVERVLPRHFELILLVNFFFLQNLRMERVDDHRIQEMSLIDERHPR